ncbi:MAG: HEPN domain-containing protein [Candidatus Latescibacterota bacterium]
MNEPRQVLAGQWVERAESDLLNVANNLGAEQVPRDTVCYHRQQAAEKYMKAVLVAADRPVPRVHDLGQLLDLLADYVHALAGDRHELQWLTAWAVGARHPAEVMDVRPGEEDGRRAHAGALRVRSVCREYLEASGLALPGESEGTPAGPA